MAQRDHLKAADPLVESSVEETATVLAEPVADEIVVETPQVAPLPPPPMRPAPHRSGFLPAVGGGALAAVIGFGLSHFNVLGLSPAPADTSAINSRLLAVEEGVTRVQDDLVTLAATPQAADPSLTDRIAALEGAEQAPSVDPRIDEVIARMSALEGQLADAAAAGTGASGAAVAALQAEMRALKTAAPLATEDMSSAVEEVKAALEQAKGLAASTQEIADSARMTAAIGQLRAALDTGQAYSAAVALLDGNEIPASLSDRAETGLPTMAALQDSFPAAARAALDAALRANPGESWTDRVSTFLRSQTGARSVTPREGNDPDAILSRAEAALANGNLDAALQEVAALPDEAKAAMADWIGLAEQRRAAAGAIDALATKLGG